MQVFYVGGRKANERKDYHLEEGEELFYMRQGDMCLKILEGDKFSYRETMVVMDLSWVDLTLEYSTILLGCS